MTAGAAAADVTFTIRMMARSLVLDVAAPGGAVAEVRYGRATGLEGPRLVTNPYYVIHGGHPAVAVSGPAARPLFLAGHTDWYLSNASIPWAAPGVASNGVSFNGGTRYVPRTDGTRNACFDRLFLTLSTRYEEMLPVVANPVSPWKHVTGTRVWRAHGASNREHDAAHWRNVHRHGMTQVVVTDHETGWRDGGESFTFRTRAAPGKGGDDGQFRYARLMQDELGFVYGPYNNFTDFAPVNGFWTPDLISRTPENQLQGAWMRCYAPKPARAVEFCERLAPPTATCTPRSRRGTVSTTTRACPAPAPSPPPSTPTARSCCCRRRPGADPSTPRATTTRSTAASRTGTTRRTSATVPPKTRGWSTSTSAACTTSAATSAWATPTCSSPETSNADAARLRATTSGSTISSPQPSRSDTPAS
jgi:hypothetical protein